MVDPKSQRASNQSFEITSQPIPQTEQVQNVFIAPQPNNKPKVTNNFVVNQSQLNSYVSYQQKFIHRMGRKTVIEENKEEQPFVRSIPNSQVNQFPAFTAAHQPMNQRPPRQPQAAHFSPTFSNADFLLQPRFNDLQITSNFQNNIFVSSDTEGNDSPPSFQASTYQNQSFMQESNPNQTFSLLEDVSISQNDLAIPPVSQNLNQIDLILRNQQSDRNVVLEGENHSSVSQSPRQEELKEDETQITGQHRQILVQQNPLVYQPVTASQSNSGRVIDQIRQDMNANPQHMTVSHQRTMLQFFQDRESESFQALMEEFMIGFQYMFSAERQALKTERETLNAEKQKFAAERKHQYEELKSDQRRWQENKEKVDALYTEEIIDLNVGGTHMITTTRNTLTQVKDSSLAAMFSGRHKLSMHNGRVFIDRNGEAFSSMLNFLRTGRVPYFENQATEYSFYDELDFWMVPVERGPIDIGELNTVKQNFDPDWCAKTLQIGENGTALFKNGNQHGIVFCTAPLDIFNCYVEFKVQIKAIAGGKSHLFMGLVDKQKQKPENLTSTFWKDSPSSLYWDVWSQKLVSVDQNGFQSGTVFGYGCNCEETISRLGILYEARSRTVSFFKNGINQGVAFTNIVSGLVPSLDVWFQSGEIHILPSRYPSQLK